MPASKRPGRSVSQHARGFIVGRRSVASITGLRAVPEVGRVKMGLDHRGLDRIGCGSTGGRRRTGKGIVDTAQCRRVQRADLDPALACGPVG